MTFPRTSQALRAALEEAGLRPDRRHGQCFLTDVQAVDAIVRDAAVQRGDTVVEVGTGPGLLTHALVETGARVISFDVDARLQRFARAQRPWPAEASFVEADVLASKRVLAPVFLDALVLEAGEGGQRRVVSNLPYSVATPILMGLLSMPEPPDDIVVMVQLEVAEKMLAGAGTPTYGAPSVLCGLRATGQILRRFPPSVFWPRPRVRSALLRLVPLRPAPIAAPEQAPFSQFVTTLFTRRRKVLRTAVAHAAKLTVPAATAACERAGVAGDVRPQDVAPKAMLHLWRATAEAEQP